MRWPDSLPRLPLAGAKEDSCDQTHLYQTTDSVWMPRTHTKLQFMIEVCYLCTYITCQNAKDQGPCIVLITFSIFAGVCAEPNSSNTFTVSFSSMPICDSKIISTNLCIFKLKNLDLSSECVSIP